MNQLSGLHPGQWNLMIAPPQKRLLIAIARLAHTLPLIVLDCGRRFDASVVARAARGRQDIIDRVRVQRAFTCHEALQLLEQLPGRHAPVVALDFLSTFYDENVKLQSRAFLLETSIRQFQRISHGAGLAVSAALPPAAPEAVYLFGRLQAAAPHVLRYEAPVPASAQLRLF